MVLNSLSGVEQATNYYAFGASYAESPARTDQYVQPYKFGGKELDRMMGLDYYDFSARTYDPIVGRFTTPDPLAEIKPWLSPYCAFSNNPVNRIDPTGRDDYFYNQKGDEINRIKTRKPDNFYLEHTKGNVTIGDKTYYQGASKESFFGDRGNGKLEMFEKVDKETMSSDEKIVATVDEYTRKGENQARFLWDSPEGKYYDYKNTVLGPDNKDNPTDNSKTAYMYQGILINRNEAGNIYWGATAGKLGFGIPGTLLGVQIFSLIDEHKFDEKSEQKAIVRGMVIYDIYGKK